MDSSHTGTPPKHENEDNESSIDHTIFDTEDDKYSGPDDCCHHIEKVSTSIQMFNIFITSLIITK
jgi:hypothetical protein